MNSIYRPDYHNCLVNLANSFLKHYGLETHHSSLAKADDFLAQGYNNVVFMLLDGMGMDMMEKNLSPQGFLRSHLKTTISSVFPPTTATATTSAYSGLTPKEHGWVGWQAYFKEYERYIELLTGLDFYKKELPKTPKPKYNLMKYQTIFSKIAEGNPKVNVVSLPWKEKDGVKNFKDLTDLVVETTTNDKRNFIHVYWPHPDSTMHKTGCYSEETKKIISEMEADIKHMAEQLRDTLLIITADHGLLDVQSVLLNDYSEICECFSQPPAIEPRCCTFFIKEEFKADFSKRFNKYFVNDFILMDKEEFILSGLHGEGIPHPKYNDFLGDFVAIATTDKILQFKSEQGVNPGSYVAHHAGLTAKEMLIPLIIWESR